MAPHVLVFYMYVDIVEFSTFGLLCSREAAVDAAVAEARTSG